MRTFVRHGLQMAIAWVVVTPMTSAPAIAGDIYGDIVLRDYDTGKERPLVRQVPIVVQTTKQRVEAVSRKGSTYYMTVPEEGRFMLSLQYIGMELSVEIGSYYHPNRYDLIILHKGDQYRLRVESTREWHERPQDKDPE